MDAKQSRRKQHPAKFGHRIDLDPRYGGKCRTCQLDREKKLYATDTERREQHKINARESWRRKHAPHLIVKSKHKRTKVKP